YGTHRDDIINGGKSNILQIEILKKPKNFSERLEFRIKTDLSVRENVQFSIMDSESIWSTQPDRDDTVLDTNTSFRLGSAKYSIQFTEKMQKLAFEDMEFSSAECYIKIYHPKVGTVYSEVFDVEEFDFKLRKIADKKKSNTICFCNRDFTVEEIENIVVALRKNTFYNNKTIEYYHQDKLFYKESSLNDNEKNNFQMFTWVLNQAFNKFKINTCIRKINFLAQMYLETAYFTDLSENNPSSNLGKFYGRGFIQLTHEGKEDVRTKNADSYLGYKKFSKLNVISDPDLLCKSLSIAADSGAWFWRYGKLLSDGSIKDLNTLADKDDVNEISRLVNGGANARKERLEANKELKKIFKYEKCIHKK
ncbi:MAG: hypothetical protein JST62_01750, partial [Bacteroidetes bacterium]|nr:hypothetical protein [Bacteroidota bacterium]